MENDQKFFKTPLSLWVSKILLKQSSSNNLIFFLDFNWIFSGSLIKSFSNWGVVCERKIFISFS